MPTSRPAKALSGGDLLVALEDAVLRARRVVPPHQLTPHAILKLYATELEMAKQLGVVASYKLSLNHPRRELVIEIERDGHPPIHYTRFAFGQ